MIWIGLITFATLGISLWRPVFGLGLLILLWPSYLLRTTVFGVPTTALELSLYMLVLAALVWWLARKPGLSAMSSPRRRGLGIETRPNGWHWVRMTRLTWWLLAAWVVAWKVGVLVAADSTAALGALKAWLVDPLLFSALLAFLVRTETDRRLLVQAAVISGVVVAVAGLVQLGWFRETLQEGRLSSFFAPVANYAAMYLGPLVVLTGSLLLSRYLRGWWWLALGLILLATVLTISFGAYLAVAAGAMFVWLHLPAGRLKRRLLIAGLVSVVIGAAALSQTKNFSQHFDFTGRSSGSVRQQIWVTSWALVRQHPWFGVGPNNFETAYRTELPKHYFPPLEWLVAQPHNLYLTLWLETGLLGLLSFLGLFLYRFRLAWREFLPRPDQRAVAVASLAALVTIFIHGFVDTPYFKNDLALEFIFLAILPWLGQKKPTMAKPEFTSGNTTPLR